jgi:ketosteroid isomerase-like protein
MSRENVEIVRNVFEGLVRGDVATFLDALDPEVEWKQLEEPRPRYGHQGVGEAIAQWLEMWDAPTFEGEEYIDGGDKVILLMRLSGRGKTSGVDVSMSSYHVFTLLDRKIVRMHEYGPGKRKEALEAVGLRE